MKLHRSLIISILSAVLVCAFSPKAAAQVYQYGRNLTIGVGRVENLDPQQAVDLNSRLLMANIYDRLYEINEKGKLVPVLAETFPQPEAPLKYAIKLKEGIHFHDGSPFDAEDVVYSFARLTKSNSPYRHHVEAIKEVEYLNRYRILVRLNRPVLNLAALFAQLEMAPMSKSFVERYGDDYGLVSACGTGPFKFYTWRRGKKVVLEKNYQYWRPKLPFINRLVFKEYKDAGKAVDSLKKRMISVAVNLNPQQAVELDNQKKIIVKQTGENRLIQLYLNAETAVLENSGIRRAISLAIDRSEIVEEIFGGYAEAAPSIFPPGSLFPKLDKPLYAYDPKTAESGLAQAGYRKRTPLKLELFCSLDATLIKISDLIKRQLAKVGVLVTVRKMNKQSLFDHIYERRGKRRSRFKIALEDWRGDYDPESFIYFPYSSHSPFNKLLKSDSHIDSLLEKMSATRNDNLKKELIVRFAEQLAESMQTVPLCFPKLIFAYNNYVSNLHMDRSGIICFRNAWTRK
ncbi:MAG: ABC transporter substrate-binding protein [bacterium]